MSQKIIHRRDYRAARQAEYPSLEDQVEAIWEALAASEPGLPAKTRDMLSRIGAVKARFPKPADDAGSTKGGKP